MPNPTVSPIRSGASMLAALLDQRFDADASSRPSAVAPELRLASDPVMPWVTPKVPRVLADLMREVGRTVELDAGAYVFPPQTSFGALVLLTDGLGARAFGSPLNQKASAIALSIPGRILGGNHCFWSERPGIGRYVTLTPARVVFAPRAALKARLRAEPELLELAAAELDLCLQSDRIGFGAIALLSVRMRLLLWALTWGLVYGELAGDRVRIAPSLPVELLASVVSANVSQVKRDLALLRDAGDWKRTDTGIDVRAALFDEPWQWLRRSEEHVSLHPRPADWRVLFKTPRRRLEAELSGRPVP
ncbi:hypothetical protein [Sutterella megalosphaeroides]|uniref:HTH crp-type domain-containing protein n=1 Tax=Sutterella megalosphaeroides TaxID=2494234 RepID=A0A2Z6I8B1_9BURK|nr:hypothetical protein [Sutterella megalosphaeroides]BBF22629.1 hypothetical protein SUTMEG_05200 [Sutterella megalosphaeroides]